MTKEEILQYREVSIPVGWFLVPDDEIIKNGDGVLLDLGLTKTWDIIWPLLETN